MMRVSKQGEQKIILREGIRLHPYRDSGGVWTIGIGAIYDLHGYAVTANTRPITRDQAISLFKQQLPVYAETVNRCIQRKRIPQPSFDAFASVCFNIGRSAFARSTFIKRFNKGDISGCAEAMKWWNKVTIDGKKQVDAGLVIRREGEIKQFLSGYEKMINDIELPTDYDEDASDNDQQAIPDSDLLAMLDSPITMIAGCAHKRSIGAMSEVTGEYIYPEQDPTEEKLAPPIKYRITAILDGDFKELNGLSMSATTEIGDTVTDLTKAQAQYRAAQRLVERIESRIQSLGYSLA